MDPIGKTAEAQAAEDALTISLSRLASPVEKAHGRRSRFWFKIKDIPAQPNHKGKASRTAVQGGKSKKEDGLDIDEIKRSMLPKEMEHIDSQIVDRLDGYKAESPDIYQSHIIAVREFFLKEVAPRTLAASGGTMQATEVIRRLLDTDVDESTVARFQNMLNRATTLKMAEFIVEYFGLPREHLMSIIGSRPPEQPAPTATQLMEIVGSMISKSNKEVIQTVRKMERRQNEK
jgi:hypothetical protein